MEIAEIEIDLSQCSPVCVGALELLLDRKFQLAAKGVKVVIASRQPAVSRAFEIMGLRPDGEPLASRHSS
jgi:anti-anti-sigma regulatory factor